VLEYIAIMQAMSGQANETKLFYRYLSGVLKTGSRQGRALRH
jgi:hypothetical protein